MRSIIMTAQEAHNFKKNKKIELIKPIKPAPPDGAKCFVTFPEREELQAYFEPGVACEHEPIKMPVVVGDAVFIREPWKRIGEKDSNVFHYAADAVSGPDNGDYFRWASPVPMPAASVRFYGRVVNIDAKLVKDAGPSWVIGVEKISKDEAESIEAGLPISDAEGDDDIGAACAAGFADGLKENEPGTAETVHKKRLEEIRVRREELESLLTAKDVDLSVEEKKAYTEEIDALNANEKDLLKASGNYKGFDFSQVEPPVAVENNAAPEPDASISEPERDEEQQTDESDKAREYTAGNCPFCGKAWTVYKSVEPYVGYPTQEAANDAAGRACECVGPMSFYTFLEIPPEEYGETSEAYEAPPESNEVTLGTCPFCFQVINVGSGFYSQEAADAAAGRICKCPDAVREHKLIGVVDDARDRIKQLFGDEAPCYGFKPVSAPEPLALLDNAVDLIARRQITGITMQIRGPLQSENKLHVKRKNQHRAQRGPFLQARGRGIEEVVIFAGDNQIPRLKMDARRVDNLTLSRS